MKNKNNYVAWMMTLSGAMFVTAGHYFEFWPVMYPVCALVGLVTTIVLED
jgi:hypothetical protein